MHSQRIFDKFSRRKRKYLQHQNTSGNFEYNTASYCCGNVGFSPRGREAEELMSFVWLAKKQCDISGAVEQQRNITGENHRRLVPNRPQLIDEDISCTHSQRLQFHTVLHLLRFHKFRPNVIVTINSFVPAIPTVRSAISQQPVAAALRTLRDFFSALKVRL